MSIRTDRVASLVRRELSDMLTREEIHDPQLKGMVSISEVEVSRDLQNATIYFSVMGAEALEVQGAFTRAAGFIRTQLGRRLKLRQTPKLRFEIDQSFEYGARMDRVINSLDIPPAEEEGEEGSGEEGLASGEKDSSA
ncbi:MAG: 30S ribosome-binding factor RbfA [Magnetococcales bacterium]|nr:30S ribosome-binding factor RbfA [Magnetococcales bacterium]